MRFPPPPLLGLTFIAAQLGLRKHREAREAPAISLALIDDSVTKDDLFVVLILASI